jgi:ATP-dependent DNA helicase RecQ
MMKKAYEFLDRYFGYKEFRQGQESIIGSVVSKKDTVGIMPTGGGKSLCYQIPALCFKGTTVVISPLISLMKDQIDFLRSKDYPAEILNSTIGFQRQREIMQECEIGNVRLLYLTPERFRNEGFLEWICGIEVSVFVIDEAHCISEWGHDFRPEYRKLSEYIRKLGRPPVLALTATATPEVRDDIIRSLGLTDPNVFVSGFNRENLIYGVRNLFSEEEKNRSVIDFVAGMQGPGIIYSSSIKGAELVWRILRSNTDRKIGLYHGSLPSQLRKKNQEDFQNNLIDVLVATNAFGMGVNKKDIRYVVHYSIPGSIEAYYQETGRAGRDGKTSYCLLLEYGDDVGIQKFFIEAKNPSCDFLCEVLENIVKHSKKGLVYADDHDLLAVDRNSNGFKIDAAVRQLHFMEAIDFEYFPEERLEIKVHKNKITDENEMQFADEILSSGGESSFIAITTKVLAKRLDMTESVLKDKLKSLADEKKIGLNVIRSGRVVKILKLKLASAEKDEYEKKLKMKKALDYEKLAGMVEYSAIESQCRRKFLLNYFGEEYNEPNCGKCDICRGTYKNVRNSGINGIQEQIIYFLIGHDGKIGKNKLIKILKGSYDMEPRYREWEECGALKNENIKDIENEFNILLKRKIIDIKDGKYPVVKISASGMNELKKDGLFRKKQTGHQS